MNLLAKTSDWLILKRNTMKSIITKLSFCLVLTLSLMSYLSAQENDVILFNGTNNAKKASRIDKDVLKRYVYSNIESAYKLSSEKQTSITKNTKRLYLDVNNLETLESEKSNSIEVVVVKILNKEDLSDSIGIEFVNNFPNLKCIYISCEVEISLSEIQKNIQTPKHNVKTYLGFNAPN